MQWSLSTSWFAVALLSAGPPRSDRWWVAGDFGDTVGEIDTCPVWTTCRAVCVEIVDLCPNLAQCANNTFLCQDGHCRDDCTGAYDNPCVHSCASVACPKTDDYYDNCEALNSEYYASEDQCAKEIQQALNSVSFREAPFVLMTLWLIGVTVSMLVYTATRPRVPKTLMEEEPSAAASGGDVSNGNGSSLNSTGQYLAGYCEHFVGTMLYYAVVITIWGFQVVFLALVILYYINSGAITVIQAMWEDERQVLLAFEVIWSIGLVWNLMLKWPTNMRSLFWTPCDLTEATQIAVWTPNPPEHGFVQSPNRAVVVLRLALKCVMTTMNAIMARIFSQDAAAAANGTWTYCQVIVDDRVEKHFVHNFRRYNLHPDSGRFLPAKFVQSWTIGELVDSCKGLTTEQVLNRRYVVGPNAIEMKEPSFWRVVVNEFTQVYYTYQNFIMWTWMPLYYYYMAIVQTTVIILGGLTVCVFRFRNETSLFKLTHQEGSVKVLRDGAYEPVPHSDLVPGDVVLLEPGRTYCDMVLVSSAGVLIDESALTGESTPVAKTAVDPAEGDVIYGSKPSHYKRSTIQAGTTILESEAGHNLAVVTKTGSYTTKGELLRDIFAYKRHQFKFDVEVEIVVFISFFYAIFTFFIVFHLLKFTAVYGWFYGMYTVASVLPPLLPTVFTVSVGVSDNRLAKRNIACTNSEEILVAGKVKRAFFDKTGTLTRQGLEFLSARSASSWDDESAPFSEVLCLGMAVCHSLTRSNAGDLIGNPVDRTMFASSGAHFVAVKAVNTSSPGAADVIQVTDAMGRRAEIVKHYDFDHHRMTQAVIVRLPGSSSLDYKIVAFVKGSGESIQQVCTPGSLPADFQDSLRANAKAGVYQISMAMKELPKEVVADLAHLSRDQVEKDLFFVGVVNFKNVIRDETAGVIRELEQGEVRSIMVTGDSVLTGICIAKEAGIVLSGRRVWLGADIDPTTNQVVWLDEDDAVVSLPPSLVGTDIDLAVSGSVWEHLLEHDPTTAAALSDSIRIYGRCTPMHKVSVVTYYIDRGFITLMCGDGGNDCGALKTAHVGIALSDAEASIVSPFTSLDKTITSVIDVLREGRCALASALASYKFMIMYGHLTVGVNIVSAYYHIMLSEWCFVFMDGLWSIGLGFTLPLSTAAKTLAPTRPTSSLLGAHTMASAVGVLFLNYLFVLLSLAALEAQDWYQCRKWENSDLSNVLVIGDNYESTVVFLVTGYQHIFTAMTYNFGYEWRGSWFSNHWFVMYSGFFTILQIYITLVPGTLSCLFRVNCDNEHVVRSVSTFEAFSIQNFWNTTLMPATFRHELLFLMLLNNVVITSWEYFVVNGTRKYFARRRRAREQQPKLLYTTAPANSMGAAV